MNTMQVKAMLIHRLQIHMKGLKGLPLPKERSGDLLSWQNMVSASS